MHLYRLSFSGFKNNHVHKNEFRMKESIISKKLINSLTLPKMLARREVNDATYK